MKKPATMIVVGAIVVGTLGIAVTAARRANRHETPCAAGFTRKGPRCLGPEPTARIVDIPASEVTIGPSDWEAEGRVASRVVKTGPFRIDAYEVTVRRIVRPDSVGDYGRPVSGITLEEARRWCKTFGGRLPTEDEWIVAAAGAGEKPRRYPWGNTGAVCSRAAFGLKEGPCARGADGPDTAGAHPDGATPEGVHDLAGNVAEWVETGTPESVVRGGAWDTMLATELRTWVRRTVPPDTKDPTIGFRCAYDVATPSGPR
jgi:formylglycine-generating enzyme required for sulfatase activity